MEKIEMELEKQLVSVGKKLNTPPSDEEELLILLEEAKSLLLQVKQSPSTTTAASLNPVKNALVAKEFSSHSNMDVKVSVASCISEITRITAPDAPYEDELMKEIFELIVEVFKGLDDISSRSFPKRISILESLARFQWCVIMLDLECDGLILEMFSIFLESIRNNHPCSVFCLMERIMTLILEESEVVPLELLNILLFNAKNVTKDILPIRCTLAEKVIGNCSAKLKPNLLVLVRSKSITLADYSRIVASICEGKSDMHDNINHNVSEDILDPEDVKAENLTADPSDTPSFPKKITVKAQQVDDTILSENIAIVKEDTIDLKEKRSKHLGKRGPLKTNEERNSQARNDLEARSPNLTGRNKDKSREDRTSTKYQTRDGNLQKGRNISEDIEGEPTLKEMASTQNSKVTTRKEEIKVKKTSRKKRGISKSPMDAENLDETLIGSIIQVWWPEDKAFYKGVVDSYSPSTKKHRVLYTDGDAEVLLLKKEKWKFVNDDHFSNEDGDVQILDPTEPPSKKKPKSETHSTSKHDKMDPSAKRNVSEDKVKGVSDSSGKSVLKGFVFKRKQKKKDGNPFAEEKQKEGNGNLFDEEKQKEGDGNLPNKGPSNEEADDKLDTKAVDIPSEHTLKGFSDSSGKIVLKSFVSKRKQKERNGNPFCEEKQKEGNGDLSNEEKQKERSGDPSNEKLDSETADIAGGTNESEIMKDGVSNARYDSKNDRNKSATKTKVYTSKVGSKGNTPTTKNNPMESSNKSMTQECPSIENFDEDSAKAGKKMKSTRKSKSASPLVEICCSAKSSKVEGLKDSDSSKRRRT